MKGCHPNLFVECKENNDGAGVLQIKTKQIICQKTGTLLASIMDSPLRSDKSFFTVQISEPVHRELANMIFVSANLGKWF